MTYSSLIFASVILPLSVLFLFFDRSAEYKNLCLCITTLLFVTWGHSLLAGLIFVSVIVDYLFALAVDGSINQKKEKGRAAVFLILDLVMNLTIILLFAHTDFFPEDSGMKIAETYIPAGAAFYALKNFSYVYDVFKGKCKAERSPFYLLTYGMSYPFMLAGPVVRYKDIAPQLRERKLTAALLSRGIKSFAVGFAKTVIAVPVFEKIAQEGLYAEGAAGLDSVIGMIAWFGGMWFGFTGLSDMGTGIACLNGFDVPLNYRRLNAKHMLGGAIKCYNTSMYEFAEDIRGDGAAAAVLTVLLAVCGAAFYSPKTVYLIVGLAAGIILAGEYLFAYDRIEELPSPLKAVITVIVSFLLFSPLAFGSIGEWGSWLKGFASESTSEVNVLTIVKNNFVVLIICFIAASPLGGMLKKAADRLSERSRGSYTAVRVTEAVLAALLLAAAYILLASRLTAAA